MKYQKLSDCGQYALGDFVFCNDEKKSTGGVIYKIVQDTPPAAAHTFSKTVMRNRSRYENGKWITSKVECAQRGLWDGNGKKIMTAALHGFIRISPVFTFFATQTGEKPKGKNQTIIVEYGDIQRRLRPADIMSLGIKYMELGNILKEIAAKKSESDSQADPEAHGEPTEILSNNKGVI